MQSLKFIRYFLYLAYNWNMRIARHILKHEISGEKKYGIDTTGYDELSRLKKKGIDISHATIYMPASYDILEEIFSWLQKKGLSHFLDIGCGKGRAMAVAAANGFTTLTGIDFSKEMCNAATKNLEAVKIKYPGINYKIINNDAFYFDIPKTVDCIFLFNPFDETIMTGVVKNIEKHRKLTSHETFVVYLNPINKELFFTAGYKEVFHTKKLDYLEGAILYKKR